MNIVKLLAFPEQSEVCMCDTCDSQYTDTVEHYIMRCNGLMDIRSQFWDVVLDSVECHEEARLLQQDEEQLMDILLTGDNRTFKYNGNKHKSFICVVSQHLQTLIYVI